MNRTIAFLALILLAMGVTTACSTVKTDAGRLDGKWLITAVNGDSVTQARPPFVEFDMATLTAHGDAGCNRFTTTVERDKKDLSAIRFAPAAATRMACLDMTTEAAILNALGDVRSVRSGRGNGEMLLVDAHNKLLFVLSRQE